MQDNIVGKDIKLKIVIENKGEFFIKSLNFFLFTLNVKRIAAGRNFYFRKQVFNQVDVGIVYPKKFQRVDSFQVYLFFQAKYLIVNKPFKITK